MTTSLPTTSEGCRAKRERVLWLLRKATTGNWKSDLSEPDVRIITDAQAAPIATGITCLADASVFADARRTAQAYAALLAAHADALERIESAEALAAEWQAEQQRLDSLGLWDDNAHRSCASQLAQALAPAQAGEKGGA